MSTGFGGINLTWAAIVIVVIPAVIIAAAELDERLRQRESPLRGAVLTIRNWALPFFAIWALLVPVLGVDSESIAARIAASGLLLSITAAVLQVLRVSVSGIQNRPSAEGHRPVPQLLLALPRIGIILVAGWFLIGGVWGVDLSAALTALGVTSLVVSFALQDTLSGLASGVLLLSEQPFKPGDWIRVGETEGMVVDLTWRTTRMRDRNGDVITVPNSELANSGIINFSAPTGLHRVVVPLQVAYVNPPTLAKEMLLDAARSTPGVLADPPPDVKVVQIDDPLMGYEVQMWIDDYSDAPRVSSDFGSLVWYQSHRHEVPLPSPAQDLYLYDGVEAGLVPRPHAGDVRTGLRRSPLLASLPDAELDRLVHASRAVRFAAGEEILHSDLERPDFGVIVNGRAQLIAIDELGIETVIAEIAEGEVSGMLTNSPGDEHRIVVRALQDCEVILIDADAVGEVGSRNEDLSAAFNQLSSIRRRRLERVADRRGVELEPESDGRDT